MAYYRSYELVDQHALKAERALKAMHASRAKVVARPKISAPALIGFLLIGVLATLLQSIAVSHAFESDATHNEFECAVCVLAQRKDIDADSGDDGDTNPDGLIDLDVPIALNEVLFWGQTVGQATNTAYNADRGHLGDDLYLRKAHAPRGPPAIL